MQPLRGGLGMSFEKQVRLLDAIEALQAEALAPQRWDMGVGELYYRLARISEIAVGLEDVALDALEEAEGLAI